MMFRIEPNWELEDKLITHVNLLSSDPSACLIQLLWGICKYLQFANDSPKKHIMCAMNPVKTALFVN